MANGFASVALKKLAKLEQALRWQRPRFVTLLVDGTKPADEAAEAALLEPLGLQPDDIVVAVTRFVDVEGLPRIQSVT
jgi:hypothetical protein